MLLRLTSFFWYNKSQKGAIYYLLPTAYSGGEEGLTALPFQAGRHLLIRSCLQVLLLEFPIRYQDRYLLPLLVSLIYIRMYAQQ